MEARDAAAPDAQARSVESLTVVLADGAVPVARRIAAALALAVLDRAAAAAPIRVAAAASASEPMRVALASIAVVRAGRRVARPRDRPQ